MSAVLLPVLLLSLALVEGSDEAREKAFAAGAEWARSGVSARCLIEVSTMTNYQESVTTETGRDAAAIKAQVLAGFVRQIVAVRDHFTNAVEEGVPKFQDLYDNGLITKAEYDKEVTLPRLEHAKMIRETAGMMQQTPSCDFFRLLQSSVTVRKAKALIAVP